MNIDTKILQNELLEMMKSFHEVCKKTGLVYYMLGGTCLGAVRHKGFIPWDDDMDVGMPREDYDKFCRMANKVLPPHLELRFYKTTSNSPFHFIKLINKNTTLVERAFKDYVEGVYIDIFPLDGMDKYNFLGKIRAKCIWICKAILIYHYTTIEKKSYKKIICFLAKKLNQRLIHWCVEKLMTINKSKYPHLMCNFFGAWEPKEIMPSSVYAIPKLYEFADAQFYGPQDADAYLKSLYGNYMQLPPENQRICRHDFYYVNLNQPYREYMKEHDI